MDEQWQDDNSNLPTYCGREDLIVNGEQWHCQEIDEIDEFYSVLVCAFVVSGCVLYVFWGKDTIELLRFYSGYKPYNNSSSSSSSSSSNNVSNFQEDEKEMNVVVIK